MAKKKTDDFNWDKWGKSWDKNWRSKKNESTVWMGIFILLIGILWYSINVGIVDIGLLCPGLMIIFGAVFILKGLLDHIFRM